MTPAARRHVESRDEQPPDPSPAIYLLVCEAEARSLALGVVPESVRAMAAAAVDWEWARHVNERRAR